MGFNVLSESSGKNIFVITMIQRQTQREELALDIMILQQLVGVLAGLAEEIGMTMTS